MTRYGIDLGGTKVEGVVIADGHPHKVLMRTRIPTEAHLGYEHILGRIVDLVNKLSQDTGIKCQSLGIGTPGTVDPKTGTLKNSNTLCLNGQPMQKDLEQLLSVPVRIANDANCFALAETRLGIVPEVAPDASTVFGVIMGTGVGGGLVVNGQLIEGHHGIAGEWGHNFLDVSGGLCYCGKTGCVERIISGKNLERWHMENFHQQRTLRDIYTDYLQGQDTNASHTINRLITFFGRALSQVINIIDPDVIVVGGGVGNLDILYHQGIMEVKKHIFNPELNTLIVKPKLGDSAGVFGAAYLADKT